MVAKNFSIAAFSRSFAICLALCVTAVDAQITLPGGTVIGGNSAGPAACGPGTGGATCGGSGPASQGSGSSINLGIGNPINIVTGNKYQREVDMPALPGVLGLEIVRHYNSNFSGHTIPSGILGRGWRLSYETELYPVGRTVQIVQADGTRIIFNRDLLDPSQCASPNPAHGKVVIQKTSRGDEYTWTWTNGRKLNFNSQGKLVQILAPSGEFVSLQHDPKGLLLKVTDPQGRELRLAYLDKQTARKGDRFRGVQTIDSPVGRFNYEYGSELPKGATLDKIQLAANLVKVGIPTHYDSNTTMHAYTERGVTTSTIARIYHYEDPAFPTLLTGITVTGSGSDGKLMNQRMVTWRYDHNGKAILSVKGEPKQTGKDGRTIAGTGIEQVTLDRSEPGQTRLTNSLGQTTTYRHAIVGGEFRLLEVRGAGCASCGETNVQYSYDKLGRLTEATQLNEQGQPIHTTKMELDYFGRTIKVSRVAYQNGKPTAPQMAMRYEYAAYKDNELPSYQPTLIARPSVVPGKEHQVRIAYNEAQQPIKVTESGWSPASDGSDLSTPIERTTTYAYSRINGRSLLTQINGQTASGITRITYDHRGGYPIEITTQGNRITKITRRDEAGRPLAITQNDGARLLQTQTIFAPQGQIQEAMQTAWLLKESSSPQRVQVDEASKLNRKLDAKYDIAGQLTFLQLPAFSQEVVSGFGSGRPEPAADTASSARTSAPVMSDTRSALQYQAGEAGSIAEREVLQILAQGGDKNTLPLARRWLDDFKRLIAVQYQGQGPIRATYAGPSDHIESLIDATGTRTQLRYDAQGQIDVLTRSTADGKLAERIEFKHAGSRLIEQTTYRGVNPGQADSRIRTRYNAFGQVTQEYQQVGKYTYAVNHAYDGAGRVSKTWISQRIGTGYATDLPSVRMRYHADGKLGNRIEAIAAGDGWFGRRSVISGLQWLLPVAPSTSSHDPAAGQSTAVVSAVATAWRYGNGLQARGNYEATPNAPFAYRLRSYHDGIHPYAIDSDASGRINGIHQRTVALNAAPGWHLLPQAQAAIDVHAAYPNSAGAAQPAPASPMGGINGNAADILPTDTAGRRLTYRSNQGDVDLVWNSAGQLAQVRQQHKEVATYSYDAQGRRISKTISADSTADRNFIYSGSQLIAEADGNGEIVKQFITVGYRPVAWIEPAHTLLQKIGQALFGPKIVYLHTDHRGAVTAATDHAQTILWNSNWDERGGAQSIRNEQTAVEQPLRLAGQYADNETGLHYNLARYYDPQTGNFLSPDPAGLGAGSLDLYAYANGDSLNFFDPDGWAKVTYYAITAGADGKAALGMNQGFTKARWAFVISDIQGGVKKNVLYDPTGGFVKTKLDYETRKGDAFAWNNGEQSNVGDPVQAMRQYYGSNLISISQFTIDSFGDEQARAILAKLGYADSNNNSNCMAGVLPQIPFALGEAAIDVTKANANGANKQRILNCQANNPTSLPINYADDIERQRVERMEAAAEVNETSALNKDCSTTGCPGINIQGQPPALGQEPRQYYASYGRSQFVAATFIETLDTVSQQDKQALGITADIQTRITLAKQRAVDIAKQTSSDPGWFKWARENYTCTDAASAWDDAGQSEMLTHQERTDFQNETLLDRQAFIDMVCFVPQGNARPIGEGRNAFATGSIFADVVLKTWLMNLYKSQDRFNFVSRVFIRNNLRNVQEQTTLSDHFVNNEPTSLSNAKPNPAYAARQRLIEEELAMRVGRLHNGGGQPFAVDTNTLTRSCGSGINPCDLGDYVKTYIGVSVGRGDWRSLRCADTDATWRGLDVAPLKLN